MISVIIPVFNTARFLSTSLKSVINQAFQELEIIVVMMLQQITHSRFAINLKKKTTE